MKEFGYAIVAAIVLSLLLWLLPILLAHLQAKFEELVG